MQDFDGLLEMPKIMKLPEKNPFGRFTYRQTVLGGEYNSNSYPHSNGIVVMWPTTVQLKNKDLKKMRITSIEYNHHSTSYLLGIKLINAAGQSSQQFGNFSSNVNGWSC